MKRANTKKGIAMVTLVAMIAIMAILVTTVTITGAGALASAKKNAFAQELMLLQNAVNSYYMSNNNLPIDNQISVDLARVPDNIKADQFAGEKIIDNRVTLYILDLKEAGIDNVTKGNREKGDTDVYAVSETTRKVYYVEGEKIQGTTYYTLNADLKGLVNISTTTNSSVTDGIIFSKNITEWTKDGIVATVKVPNTYTVDTLSVTNGIANRLDTVNTTTGYKSYIINEAKTGNNYSITIKYSKDGIQKIATFDVLNFDNVAPNLTVGAQNYVNDPSTKKVNAFINDIVATDIASGIKVVKYESDKISNTEIANYFKNAGKLLTGGIIPLEAKKNYTIYVEDNAGNITSTYVTINDNIISALNTYK